MKSTLRSVISILAGAACIFLVSCAGSTEITAMSPANVSASTRTGVPIRAVVTGGTPRSNVLANVTNEDFKGALETSLVKSGMFKSEGSGGYQLDAFISSIDQPMMGLSMQVSVEVNYSLSRNGAPVWRKAIKSSYVAPVGESLVGAVRLRKATEGAVRENITLLIRALDEKRL